MLANTPSLARRLAGTGLALGLAAAGLTLSLPAAAEPTTLAGTYAGMRRFQEKAEPVRKEVRIIEMVGGDKMTDAERAQVEKMAEQRKCPDGSEAITADTPETKPADGKVEKRRMLICTKGAATKEEAIQGLEKALGRVQANAEMDAAIKAEISAKLQARIAELKAK